MKISLETAALCNHKITFPAWDYDMLYSYDIDKHQLSKIEGYNFEGLYEGPKYGSIQKYNNKLICVPLYSKNIVIFDIKTKTINKIELELINRKRDLFFESLVYNNCIFLFPGESEYIVEMNLETYQIEYIKINTEQIKLNENGIKSFARHGISVRGEFAFLACLNTNKIFKFNLKTKQYEFISISEVENVTSVCNGRNDNEIFILTSGGMILVLDLLTYRCSTISEGINTQKIIGYSEMQYNADFNTVVILPFEEKNIYIVNIIKKEKKTIPCDGYVFWSTKYKNDVYAYVFSEQKMIKIDLIDMELVEKFEINDIDIEFNQEDAFPLRHSCFSKNVYKEKGEESLGQFINYIRGF